jgi:2-keto-4-pentenoate hydratase/2-oxohepta-3-ene-1,7-dioic acid hydratase in catechol pathway
MAINLIRYRHSGTNDWGVLIDGRIAPLSCGDLSTAELLRARPFDGAAPTEGIDVANVELLAPITAPCRVLCQGANYRQHMIESGVNPDDKQFNLLFMKSDASLAPPRRDLRVPPQVQLLDYELELGLVFGEPVDGPVTITAENLHEYVAALVMANDLSARDIQLPQNQWFKGKSYRGCCPIGPVLCVLERDDYALLDQLELTLLVNDRVRQHDSTANLVYGPLETLSELSQVSDLAPGDVLLTGTPAGCALRAPAPFVQKLMGLLPERVKWRAFINAQKRRDAYLKPGDIVRSTIKSADRRIDLGEQLLRVTKKEDTTPTKTPVTQRVPNPTLIGGKS